MNFLTRTLVAGVFSAGWLAVASLSLGGRAKSLPPTSGVETGVASWYGPGFYGRLTASGETFWGKELTAAHPSLPFGTWVRVVNLDNGESTIVRINDRGPFIEGRVIDLSRKAAEAVGLLVPGTAQVELHIQSKPLRVPVSHIKQHYQVPRRKKP